MLSTLNKKEKIIEKKKKKIRLCSSAFSFSPRSPEREFKPFLTEAEGLEVLC